MLKKIVLAIVILALIGGGVWYFILKDGPSSGPEEVIEIDPVELMVFEVQNENLSEFQREGAFERFTKAKNTINLNLADGINYEEDPNYYAWLDIASAQKLIGDYERAAKLWLWFTDAYPGNSISPANLGDLYKSFIVDQEKSEKYYLIALEREKKDFQIYLGLYELYRYRFEDEDKAIKVLEDGIENNPNKREYVVELVDYLVVLDKKDEAEKILDEWLVNHPEDYSLKSRLETN